MAKSPQIKKSGGMGTWLIGGAAVLALAGISTFLGEDESKEEPAAPVTEAITEPENPATEEPQTALFFEVLEDTTMRKETDSTPWNLVIEKGSCVEAAATTLKDGFLWVTAQGEYENGRDRMILGYIDRNALGHGYIRKPDQWCEAIITNTP